MYEGGGIATKKYGYGLQQRPKNLGKNGKIPRPSVAITTWHKWEFVPHDFNSIARWLIDNIN